MTVISSTERTHLAPLFFFRISFWKRYLVNFMFVLQQNSYALLRFPRADKLLWNCSYITTSSLTKQFKVWWDTSVTAPRRENESNWWGQTIMWSLVFTSIFRVRGVRKLEIENNIALLLHFLFSSLIFHFFFFFFLAYAREKQAGRWTQTPSAL